MVDPNNAIKGDLDEAARLRWEEKSADPNLRNSLERAAQGLEAEAAEIQNEIASEDEGTDEENPE